MNISNNSLMRIRSRLNDRHPPPLAGSSPQTEGSAHRHALRLHNYRRGKLISGEFAAFLLDFHRWILFDDRLIPLGIQASVSFLFKLVAVHRLRWLRDVTNFPLAKRLPAPYVTVCQRNIAIVLDRRSLARLLRQ